MGYPGMKARIVDWDCEVVEQHLWLRSNVWLFKHKCSVAMVLEKSLEKAICLGPYFSSFQVGEPKA